MLLWSILEKSNMSPRIVSSVSPLSRMVSASSLQPDSLHQSLAVTSPQFTQEYLFLQGLCLLAVSLNAISLK